MGWLMGGALGREVIWGLASVVQGACKGRVVPK